MVAKLTKAQVRALNWFAQRDEPASRFGPNDPSLSMVKKLRDAGLVETVAREPGVFGFSRFAITHAGREALFKAAKATGAE